VTRDTAPQHAVSAARDIFGNHLALAFVGGSHARATSKPSSDIDIFVVLNSPQRDRERRFASVLRDLHTAHALSFDHCGEVFDAQTLENLLAFTERCIAAAPAIQRAACYQADCALSIFRKGDVVFKFLVDPKICIHDPHDTLPALGQRAHRYFTRWPMPRIQEHKGQLILPEGSAQQDLVGTWDAHSATGGWADTPVGIGLERWFGPVLDPRAAALSSENQFVRTPDNPRSCPLTFAPPRSRRVLQAQCLAFPPTPQERT
jgi:predicted nucleotidyltransferase